MVSKFLLVLVSLVLTASVASAQQIYKWKDKKGQWHFSDAPPAEVKTERMKGMDIPPKSAQPITGMGVRMGVRSCNHTSLLLDSSFVSRLLTVA